MSRRQRYVCWRAAAPKRRVAGSHENPVGLGGEIIGHFRLPCALHGMHTIPESKAPFKCNWLKCPITITNVSGCGLPTKKETNPRIISVLYYFLLSLPD